MTAFTETRFSNDPRGPLTVALVTDPALPPAVELCAAFLRRVCKIGQQQNGIIPCRGISWAVGADSHLQVVAGMPPCIAGERACGRRPGWQRGWAVVAAV